MSSEPPLQLRPRARRRVGLRPTRAEIDLGAIADNYAVVARAASGAGVLAVVKADAYGHGLIPVSERLAEAGCYGLAVALAEEGLELREAGVETRIVILNGVYGGAHAEVLARRLTPVVYDLGQVEAFAAVAGARPFGVHLHVDTGMHRLGVPMSELDVFLSRLQGVAGLRVDGLMTHLSCADGDDAYTARQLEAFREASRLVAAHGHRPRVRHAANSAATFRHPGAHYDVVRPGLALYGDPGAIDVALPLRGAMRWRSEIVHLHDVAPGARIGYEGSFVAPTAMRVATLPVGYGDGLARAAEARRDVLVRGQRCPLIGRVSMDLTTIDVSRVPGATHGDEVVLLGAQRSDGAEDMITARELADATGTIPYEVLCAVSQRVPRYYFG